MQAELANFSRRRTEVRPRRRQRASVEIYQVTTSHVVEDAGPRALVGACAPFTLREYYVVDRPSTGNGLYVATRSSAHATWCTSVSLLLGLPAHFVLISHHGLIDRPPSEEEPRLTATLTRYSRSSWHLLEKGTSVCSIQLIT